jgi:protocatechuate 3,4-dioxygenase beta subunit
MRDDQEIGHDPRRRAVVKAMLVVPVAGLAVFSGARAALAATPECADDEPTPPQGAGPFFTPGAPERASFVEPGLRGQPLVVTGQVLSTACAPAARALLDFWHADDGGRYDVDGFRLRGHQYADASGRFRLETIMPGGYGGLTRHIHVRVQAPHGRVLTTQMLFPEATESPRLRQLVVNMASPGEGRFDFVLAT